MKVENNFLSINEAAEKLLRNGTSDKTKQGGREASFADILSAKELERAAMPDLRFSKHAMQRITDRNMDVDDAAIKRLREATERAESKGINDLLVMVDDMAFIMNTGSRTVVTAMNAEETKDNVFSNIDGAVIA
ncbi:MAG: hypothetical protein K5985_10135 [Lachnospiraceae bacterium]|nr:hypothetical protein [Lachnospiraceae bacterium]